MFFEIPKTLLLKAIFILSLILGPQALKNNDVHVMTTLSEHLRMEWCDLYLVGVQSDFIVRLNAKLKKSVFVIKPKNNKIAMIDFGRCVSVVTNSIIDISALESIRKSIRRFYVVGDDMLDVFERDGFPRATLLFIPTREGSIDLFSGCPGIKNITLFNHYTSKTHVKPLSLDFCPHPLRGKEVKVVTAAGKAPHIIYEGNGGLSGVDPSVIKIVAKTMGFTYKISMERDWGVLKGDTWSGTIGKIQNGSAHFGIGCLAIQENRFLAVDYTTPTYTQYMVLVTRKPLKLKSYMNFLLPFDTFVWSMVLSAIVLATMINVVTKWFLKRHGHITEEVDYIQEMLPFYKNITLQHPTESPWISIACAITWSFWHFFSFVIINSFLCNLRADLMRVGYEHPVDTELDLLDLNRRLFLPLGTPLIAMYASSSFPAQIQLNRDIQKSQQFFSFINGSPSVAFELSIIRDGQAYLTGREQGQASLAVSDKRFAYVPFRVGKKAIFPFYAGYAVPRGVPWKEEVDKILLKLIQGGIVEHLIRSNIKEKYLQEERPDDEPIPFTIPMVLGIMFLLFGGLIIASIVFFVEVHGTKLYSCFTKPLMHRRLSSFHQARRSKKNDVMWARKV